MSRWIILGLCGGLVSACGDDAGTNSGETLGGAGAVGTGAVAGTTGTAGTAGAGPALGGAGVNGTGGSAGATAGAGAATTSTAGTVNTAGITGAAGTTAVVGAAGAAGAGVGATGAGATGSAGTGGAPAGAGAGGTATALGGAAGSAGTAAGAGGAAMNTGGAGGAGDLGGAGGGTFEEAGAAGMGVETGGAGSGMEEALTLVDPIERGNEYVLELSDGTYFAVSRAGGRITAFGVSSSASDNILDSDHSDNFGSTFWTGPQSDWDWPPVEAIDSANYGAPTLGDGSISMTSSGATFGDATVSITKTFTANLAEGGIDVTYTITNDGSSSVTLASWEVTRVDVGGISFFPQGTTETAGGTDLPRTEDGGYIWFDEAAQGLQGGKFFADGTEGWLAHTDGSYLYVKEWTDVPAGQMVPDEGEVQIYDGRDDGYIELEVEGPYETIAAGASSSFTVRWTVQTLDFSDGSVGDQRLLDAVTAILE